MSTIEPKPSWTSKLKTLSKQYGRAALVVYISISLIDLSLLYTSLRLGIDADKHLAKLPFFKEKQINQAIEEDTGSTVQEVKRESMGGGIKGAVGTFAIAYAIHKLLLPLRVGATVALTPSLARWWQRRRMLG